MCSVRGAQIRQTPSSSEMAKSFAHSAVRSACRFSGSRSLMPAPILLKVSRSPRGQQEAVPLADLRQNGPPRGCVEQTWQAQRHRLQLDEACPEVVGQQRQCQRRAEDLDRCGGEGAVSLCLASGDAVQDALGQLERKQHGLRQRRNALLEAARGQPSRAWCPSRPAGGSCPARWPSLRPRPGFAPAVEEHSRSRQPRRTGFPGFSAAPVTRSTRRSGRVGSRAGQSCGRRPPAASSSRHSGQAVALPPSRPGRSRVSAGSLTSFIGSG